MKSKIFVLLLLGCTFVSAQTVPDSTSWYFPWEQRMEKATSIKEYQAIKKEFEQRYRNQPRALLRLYLLYQSHWYDILTRNLRSAKSDRERALVIKSYGYGNRDAWEDFVLTVAHVADQADTIPDTRLRDFARMMQKSAKRIRFYRQLKTEGVPDFQFTDLQGKEHHFREFKGRYVLLSFWNRRSVPCMDELPYLKKAQEAFKDKLQIVAVYVSFLEDPMEKEIVRNLIKEMGLNWIHIVGPQGNALKKQFFIRTFPTNLVFDPDGRLLNRSLDSRMLLQGEKLQSTLKKYFDEKK